MPFSLLLGCLSLYLGLSTTHIGLYHSSCLFESFFLLICIILLTHLSHSPCSFVSFSLLLFICVILLTLMCPSSYSKMYINFCYFQNTLQFLHRDAFHCWIWLSLSLPLQWSPIHVICKSLSWLADICKSLSWLAVCSLYSLLTWFWLDVIQSLVFCLNSIGCYTITNLLS